MDVVSRSTLSPQRAAALLSESSDPAVAEGAVYRLGCLSGRWPPGKEAQAGKIIKPTITNTMRIVVPRVTSSA
jgi:hypothetical protein